MGDIADQIVNGECCEFCQMPSLVPLGYPFTCDGCRDETPPRRPVKIKKSKSNCPSCNKLVKKIGFHHHIQVCHPELLVKAFNALNKVLEDSK